MLSPMSRVRPVARILLLAGSSLAVSVRPGFAAPSPVTILPDLAVHDSKDPLLDAPAARHDVSRAAQRRAALSGPDTAALFRSVPGFSLWANGGISSLPVLNGQADDRVATFVDGVRIQPACPNHMNPALSYVAPDMIQTATAIAGITPVSMGGDSLSGTVSVERRDPQFARRGKILTTGWARGAYHSNGSGWEGAASGTVANDWLSLNYSASYAERGNYKAGDGAGIVRSTLYKTYNHSVTAGMHKGANLLVLTFSQTDTPYEGFPTAWMDMTNNRSTDVHGKYLGSFDWGTVEARGYWQRVNHVMNNLADKGGYSWNTGMPMNDNNRIAGYSLKITLPLGHWNTLRVGSSFDHEWLADWWPPLPGSMMMGPSTYTNINNGRRDRLGNFVEWESHPTSHIRTLLGVRSDIVRMNAGQVWPYDTDMSLLNALPSSNGIGGVNGMAATGTMASVETLASNAFNAQDRHHTDVNFDVTALVHDDISERFSIEGGYARKTRSPNLFERYAWGQAEMDSTMVGWFGDANGYTGNNNLRPEIGHTASITADWHDPQGHWSVMVQPYYTYVQHYINVDRLATYADGFALLRFANHNAQYYGLNASARAQIWVSPRFGTGVASTKIDWVRGQDDATHTGLYHQMPANGTIALDDTLGNWTVHADLQLVKRKSTVDALRNEPRTPGYAIANLDATYRWRMARFELGLDNVLNQHAYLPLGGVALGNYLYSSTVLGQNAPLNPLSMMGRSVNASVMLSF